MCQGFEEDEADAECREAEALALAMQEAAITDFKSFTQVFSENLGGHLLLWTRPSECALRCRDFRYARVQKAQMCGDALGLHHIVCA